jgi:hypothetical protein
MSVVTASTPPSPGRVPDAMCGHDPETALYTPRKTACMLPVAPAAGVVDALANDPVLVVLVAVLLLAVFGGYFYIRRTLMNLRDGYEDAYRGK